MKEELKHVPPIARCREMMAIPDLRQAFQCCWHGWSSETTVHICSCCGPECVPAPDIGEMLAWLTARGWHTGATRTGNGLINRISRSMQTEQYDITDPDALAKAVLEATRA